MNYDFSDKKKKIFHELLFDLLWQSCMLQREFSFLICATYQKDHFCPHSYP
jgi:hypothetical protein